MDMLSKCDANYVPLSPLTFLKRASLSYADRTSIVYGGVSFTWTQTYQRCRRLASSLRSLNILKNDVVSVLAPNIPAMYEMHFGVPMAGAVINPINTRLDAKSVAAILLHSSARLLFVDLDFLTVALDAKLLFPDPTSFPLLVLIDDLSSPTRARTQGELNYEELIVNGDPEFAEGDVADEWDPIALNYTSGTTSDPKGVVYSHRGAYLSTLSMIVGWGMGTEPVYLWTLPMFHCNGWTFTWGIAARGGTNVCLRSTTGREIYDSISLHRVTHMCCAPTVLNILLEAEEYVNNKGIHHRVEVLTGGAPPPAALLRETERLGFHVTHAYGMTEATGPVLVCEWRREWDRLPREEQARIKARQGVSVLNLADVNVVDFDTRRSVPRDGTTKGEIVLRGSGVMKGYYKNPGANAASFGGGWFKTGDVGVVHVDGYVEIKDRLKDVIISGGENISSVEVEAAVCSHPRVAEAAAVAMPHARWGETPCAFVVAKRPGSGDVSEGDVILHCRRNLPGYMVPRKVVFVAELPRTMGNKVDKNELRDRARELSQLMTVDTTSGNLSDKNKTNEKVKDDMSEEEVLVLSRL